MSTRDIGNKAEDRAAEFLRRQGYQILDRNFRSKFGEIDLVALDGETLVFVEVKARASRRFGLPEEAVNPRKIRHITLAGQYYASLHPTLPQLQRIDVISIEGDELRLISVV
ncbi:MAG TPA: YraN family protein [Patescibacteria group bacterium]|nr:YraN family protein [Patescibacteria group bacterium]